MGVAEQQKSSNRIVFGDLKIVTQTSHNPYALAFLQRTSALVERGFRFDDWIKERKGVDVL